MRAGSGYQCNGLWQDFRGFCLRKALPIEYFAQLHNQLDSRYHRPRHGFVNSKIIKRVAAAVGDAGASGLIGSDYVSKQPADGYNILVSHASVHVYATATRRTIPFDPVNDFTHMGMLVEAPMVLLVRAASPFTTLEHYVNAAKTKPVRYGSSGIGSANHLFGELLKIESKAPQHDHASHQGSAPAMQDLLGDSIDSLLDAITTNVGQLKGGSLRALAVSTPSRLPALANIPAFAALGYPKLTGWQWLGLSAPKNLPAPIVQRLTALIPEIFAKPDFAARLEELQTCRAELP